MEELIKNYLKSNTSCELVEVLSRPTGFDIELVYRGKHIDAPAIEFREDLGNKEVMVLLDLYIHFLKVDYFDYIDDVCDSIYDYEY